MSALVIIEWATLVELANSLIIAKRRKTATAVVAQNKTNKTTYPNDGYNKPILQPTYKTMTTLISSYFALE